MKPDSAVIMKPLKLNENTHIAVTSSENKLLVFKLAEINEYPNGGRGVTIMDLPEGSSLTRIEFCDGNSVSVIIKGRKTMEISGENMDKYLLKRARKGCLINVTTNRISTRSNRGLFE